MYIPQSPQPLLEGAIVMSDKLSRRKPVKPIENLDGEIWKDVVGWEDSYEVSNMGRVKSKFKVVIRSTKNEYTAVPKLLKPAKDECGYVRVGLSKLGK